MDDAKGDLGGMIEKLMGDPQVADLVKKLKEGDSGGDGKDAGPAPDAGGGSGKYAAMAQTILRGLGGADNLLSIDNCVTRLRLEIKDETKVDDGVIRSSGAIGVIRPGKNAVQVVIGTTVQFVADELKALARESSRKNCRRYTSRSPGGNSSRPDTGNSRCAGW